jgi:hypothetical protein
MGGKKKTGVPCRVLSEGFNKETKMFLKKEK